MRGGFAASPSFGTGICLRGEVTDLAIGLGGRDGLGEGASVCALPGTNLLGSSLLCPYESASVLSKR